MRTLLRNNQATARCWLTMALLLASCAAACHAAKKMPVGSYLRKPAPDAATLNKQIKDDPLVVERFARLFRMSPRSVRDAFRGLHLMKLPRDMVTRVYYVHPNEELGYRMRRVRKGTPVFALPDNTPALIQVCGNPMRTDLKSAVKSAKKVRDFSPDDREEAQAAGPEEIADADGVLHRTEPASLETDGDTRAAQPDDAWNSVASVQPDTGFTPDAAAPAPGFAPSGGGGGLAGGLLLTGLAGLTQWLNDGGSGSYYGNTNTGGGSGGGNNNNYGGNNGSNGGSGGGGNGGNGNGGNGGGGNDGGNYNSVVPESDAMTLLVFGLLGVGLVQLGVWYRGFRALH